MELDIAMKGNDVKQEIDESKKAINLLGAEIIKIEEFNLPNTEMKRSVVLLKKQQKTLAKYPRKPGMPAKEPLK